MPRLTPPLILASPIAYVNGHRTINFRSQSIPLIENLSILLDSLDTIDLSSNSLTSLTNLSSLHRLKELLCPNNEIVNIGKDISLDAPNLDTLVLDNNIIPTLKSLLPLFSLKSLTFLSLLSNPLTKHPLYRVFVIANLESLKVLDYKKIGREEREKANRFKESKACRKLWEDINSDVETTVVTTTTSVGIGGEGIDRTVVKHSFSEEVNKNIKRKLEATEDMDEIEKIMEYVKRGEVPLGCGGGSVVDGSSVTMDTSPPPPPPQQPSKGKKRVRSSSNVSGVSNASGMSDRSKRSSKSNGSTQFPDPTR